PALPGGGGPADEQPLHQLDDDVPLVVVAQVPAELAQEPPEGQPRAQPAPGGQRGAHNSSPPSPCLAARHRAARSSSARGRGHGSPRSARPASTRTSDRTRAACSTTSSTSVHTSARRNSSVGRWYEGRRSQ